MAPRTNQFLVIGNMKMNVVDESYLNEYTNLLFTDDKYNVILLPPSPFIITLHNILGSNKIQHLGAQNIHSEIKGSFTGATSVEMLKSYISYILVGHSERRMLFAEKNSDIQKQLKLTLDNKLIPILAVGESSEDKANNQFQTVIKDQLSVLSDINTSNLIYIAYEPVWAIGTGDTASSQYIEDAADIILKEINNINPRLSASIIYGGSVTENNIAEICNISNINGALVGGASADITQFTNILQTIKEAY
ncbi:MAG: triose-phosphate isomerase [Dehalococcoidaceae bacterium]|nr:triose-phosphate isomerase [Dehalococcoidaceae bacterium]